MLSSRQQSTAAGADHDKNRRTSKIRDFNDAFRQKLPRTGKGCRLNVTTGVAALSPEQLARLLLGVRTYVDFSSDNDPHGEHDFGSLEQDGNRFFWKIDQYDQWMQFGSSDPTDPSVTVRVLTIMRADEY